MDILKLVSQIAKLPAPPERFSVDDLPRYQAHSSLGGNPYPGYSATWGGDKWSGSFGETKIFSANYWELRARSDQLFHENLYARGIVRRLVTSEINTGLMLEAEPLYELVPSLSEDGAQEWSSETENRFEIWARTPSLCDYEGRRTYAQLQETIRREALVSGDVLVVLRHPRTPNTPPAVQIIRGSRVASPIDSEPRKGNRVVHGVELDPRGRQVAYHVSKPATSLGSALETTRIPTVGERSGKRVAWIVYGTDFRQDDVRGQPLLSIVLQSLKEIDRYRDSEQRAATVNSLLAMFITKEPGTLGTLPVTGGAVRQARATGTGLDGQERQYNLAGQFPGLVFEELNAGEVPKAFDTSRPNVNYPVFEAAVLSAVAWANEIPPEVLLLSFSSNYSASKAAINEFKAYIARVRSSFGSDVCQPIYCEWLVTEALAGRLPNSQAFLSAWRDPAKFVEFGAWVLADWGGPVKPSIEHAKDVQAYIKAIEARLISRDRATKDLYGVRFAVVARRIAGEDKIMAALGASGIDALTGAAPPPPPTIVAPPAPGAPKALTEARILELAREVYDDAQDEEPAPPVLEVAR